MKILQNKYFYVVFICFAFASQNIFAQAISSEKSKSVGDDIVLENEISDLSKKIENAKTDAEKKEFLEKLARYQEYANLFPEAEQSYVTLSMMCSENEKIDFVLKGARCSLCYGNNERCDELLSTIAAVARKNEYAPLLKLYAVWSWIAKCTTYEETFEPIAILKSYLDVPSMNNVRQQMLFTLFYITGQTEYAKMLKDEFPLSMEYGIVTGKIELNPSPFWFFSCRKMPNKNELAKVINVTDSKSEKTPTNAASNQADSSSITTTKSSSSATNEILYYQLGFFSYEENASDLVKRAKDKNIAAQIQKVTKTSGNVYYAVIVKTNDASMGNFIRNSGFECYPVFKE